MTELAREDLLPQLRQGHRLWRLAKALNEDVTLTPRTTILEEDSTLHTGRAAANLLAGVFQKESSIQILSDRKREINNKVEGKPRSQNPTPTVTSELFQNSTMQSEGSR